MEGIWLMKFILIGRLLTGNAEMKKFVVAKMICFVFAISILTSGIAFSQSKHNVGLPWDGLIELSSGSIAAGIGLSWGGGKLIQAGKEYPLRVDGLSAGSVGITKANA